ncbi:MAG TPA: MBL fold metallo-hydrolase [Acetobacteraceae bacterium]|nr:MBL fold metallo-hydrolase [Acetobacteraceae bacterium]
MFHRFRIGAWQATILSDGPLSLPAPSAIFSGVAEPELRRALSGAGLPTDRVRVEQNCLLIDTGAQRLLFDNGMGTSKLFGEESGRLLTSFAEAGIAPDFITHMVLTHAHSDHCWGTMRDDGVPNFPNAAIVMSSTELAFWESEPSGQGRRSVAGVKKHLIPLRERIKFVADGEELVPGIQAWSTPGHTPGHMAYLFTGGGGEAFCLAGDVAFFDPLSFAFPDSHSLYDADPAVAAATRRRVLERLASDRLRVIGYHQPWPGLGRVERAGSGFRFIQDGGET